MKFSNNILIFLSELILAITYSVVMFSLVSTKDSAFFANYLFTCISFLLTFFVSLSIFNKKIELHNLFYQFPLLAITLIYGVGQLILSGAFAYYEISYQYTLSISTAVLGIYLISAISTILISRFHESTHDIPTEQETFIRKIKLALFEIQQAVTDKKIKTELETLENAILYSDPVSLPETKEIEEQIIEKLCLIKKKNITLKFISEIQKDIKLRNNLLKELK